MWRTEGERPESSIMRWEAVFRRERMPVSIDRTTMWVSQLLKGEIKS